MRITRKTTIFFFWYYPTRIELASRHGLYMKPCFLPERLNHYCINLQYPDLIYCALHKLSSIVQKLYNYYRRCAKFVQRKCLILLIKLILTYRELIYNLLISLKFFYYATAISILSFSLMLGTILNLKLSKYHRCIQIDGEKDRR